MKDIANLLRFAMLFALAGAFVFSCIVIVRHILQKLLSPRLMRIHEAIKPLFDPSYDYDPAHLEKSYWLCMSVLIITFLTFALAAYLSDMIDALWDLLRML